MATIACNDVTKVYPDGTPAVSQFSLAVADGELVVFVGPSGCGKTTALRMVAGLEPITEGTIAIGGRVVNDVPAKKRDIAMVFQNYALYPHMSVYDNIAFGLRMRRMDRAEIRTRVLGAARTLGLSEMLGKRPGQLSGGQRQRVAMGRAVVRRPQVFLMDEPLSNLDAKLRVQMRAEIARVQRDVGVTTIYVTHDQSEAMTLGDRVCVLRGGQLQQVDKPQVLYDSPANLFVASFIGSPAMNLVEAEVVGREQDVAVAFGPHRLPVDAAVVEACDLRRWLGRRVAVGIRPEDISDAALISDAPPEVCLDVTVDIREAMGSEVLVHFASDASLMITDDVAEAVGPEAIEVGDEQSRGHGGMFVARVDRSTRLQEGDRAKLAVDTRRLHFFDPATGATLRAANEPREAPALTASL